MHDMIRADHTTVERPVGLEGPPVALAAHDAVCPHCDEPVDEDEPIVLTGQYVEQDEHGNRTVDLSGALWLPQRCAAKGTA